MTVGRARLAARAAILAAAAVGGATALAGADAGGVAAVAAAATSCAYFAPWCVPALLVLLVPIGFWTPEIAGVQAPPIEVAAGAAATVFVVDRLLRRHTVSVDLTSAACLALVAALGVGVAADPDVVRLRRLVFWSSLTVVLLAARRCVGDRRMLLTVAGAFGFVAAVESVAALAQFAADTPSTVAGASSIVAARPTGTLTHPNELAQALLLCLFPLLGLGLGLGRSARIAVVSCATAVVLAIGASLSRGTWIALVVGGVVVLAAVRRRSAVLTTAAIAIVAVGFLAALGGSVVTGRARTALSLATLDPDGFRAHVWARAVHAIARAPVIGSVRFETTARYDGVDVVASHPHDLYLGAAVFFGIPAACALAALMALAVRSSWRTWRHGAEARTRLLALYMLAGVVAFLVVGIGEYPFWSESLTALVVVSIAICCALDRGASQAGHDRG